MLYLPRILLPVSETERLWLPKKTNNVRQAGEDASVHPVSRPENSGRERRADCSDALHPGRQTPQTKFYRLNQRKEESGWQIMGIAIYPGRCGPSWGL